MIGKIWIIVVLLYGAGLRIQDCLGLRVKDIDFDRHQIVVRRGKGQKDGRMMLPEATCTSSMGGRWGFAVRLIGCERVVVVLARVARAYPRRSPLPTFCRNPVAPNNLSPRHEPHSVPCIRARRARNPTPRGLCGDDESGFLAWYHPAFVAHGRDWSRERFGEVRRERSIPVYSMYCWADKDAEHLQPEYLLT